MSEPALAKEANNSSLLNTCMCVEGGREKKYRCWEGIIKTAWELYEEGSNYIDTDIVSDTSQGLLKLVYSNVNVASKSQNDIWRNGLNREKD